MSNVHESRRSVLMLAAAILVSTSLHVVPQWLRHLVDPAWSMLVLMVVDAILVATIVRSRAAIVTGGLLAALLFVTIALNKQIFAALPSVLLNVMLAAAFGATLRGGQTPLIVRIETAAAGSPPAPEFERYLRNLTWAWTVFFIANGVASLLLIVFAPFEWWSLFSNVLTWPLIGAMFAIEWMVRRLLFPQLPAHTPLNIATKIFAYRRQAGARGG